MINKEKLDNLEKATADCIKNNQITSIELNNAMKDIVGEGKKEIKEDGKTHYSGYLDREMFDEMFNDSDSVLDF